MEHTESLVRLKTLQLGNNQISAIGNALDKNHALEDLNISGNNFSSFREILNLARLPSLTSLCLSDPNFAENPICSLCNYQTHVVYYLLHLRYLDTLEVTEESRRMIIATIMKKRMYFFHVRRLKSNSQPIRYYNMRIRTIKRNTNYLIKLLDDVARENCAQMTQDLCQLNECSKKLAKRLFDIQLFKTTGNEPNAEIWPLEKALTLAAELAKKKQGLQEMYKNHVQSIKDEIQLQGNMSIRKLLLELETGGNVRFEDEQKNAEWIKECEGIVKYFTKKAVTKDGPKSIQIHRISRLHNRPLKLRLAQKLGVKYDPETNNGQILCSQLYQDEDKIFDIVEHGLVGEKDSIFTDYMDCKFPTGTRRLQRALIIRAHVDRVTEIEENHCNYFISKNYQPTFSLLIRDSTIGRPDTGAVPWL